MIGDLALSIDSSGKPLPGVAQLAMQQETYAAKAIVRKVQGRKDLPPFTYLDKGSLAVIGRWAAVFRNPHVGTAGLAGMGVHPSDVYRPVPERILVFVQWAIQDLTFSRGARLITGAATTDFNFDKELASVAKNL